MSHLQTASGLRDVSPVQNPLRASDGIDRMKQPLVNLLAKHKEDVGSWLTASAE